MRVGDYVRTKNGGIGKIIEIDNNASCHHIITDNETFGLGWDGEQVNWDFITEIVKSSPNIIDLIEVGDYVNGKKVTKTNLDKTMNGETAILCGDSNYDCLDVIYKNCDIKSIVTKEQFEEMEYKI